MELWGQSFPGRGDKRSVESAGEGHALGVHGLRGSGTGRTVDNVVRRGKQETHHLRSSNQAEGLDFLPEGSRQGSDVTWWFALGLLWLLN